MSCLSYKAALRTLAPMALCTAIGTGEVTSYDSYCSVSFHMSMKTSLKMLSVILMDFGKSISLIAIASPISLPSLSLNFKCPVGMLCFLTGRGEREEEWGILEAGVETTF